MLDEATASVDILTDSLVQTVVREQFAGESLLTAIGGILDNSCNVVERYCSLLRDARRGQD